MKLFSKSKIVFLKHRLSFSVLIAGLFFLSPIGLSAQFSYKVNGTVISDEKPLTGATVSLNTSENLVKEIITGTNGNFNFTLEPNEEYTITIAKSGYTTAHILYSTMILSEEDENKIKDVSKPEIEIFPLPSTPEEQEKINTILNKPLLSYYFNADKKNIISDEIYEQTFESNMAKLRKITASEGAKNEAALALENNYKALLTKADRAFTKNDYETAKSIYNDAIKLKPDELYPKSKISEIDKLLADAASRDANAIAEKERLAKEKELADAKAKQDALLKAKEIADAKESERLAKEKEKADAAEKERLAKEKLIADANSKAAADAAEKERERLAKEKEKADAAEKEKLTKEKLIADANAKAAADAAEKERVAKEKEEEAARQKAIAEAAEKERLEKEKALAEEKEKQRLEKEKTLAEEAEKERLKKEAAEKIVTEKYNKIIVKADSALNEKNYALAKSTYNEALTVKPKEIYPKDKITEIDIELENIAKADYTNELAKKYKQGITEEIEMQGSTKITKRILVQGNKGYLFMKKETGFGATYYFKDGVAITEQEFKKFTETKP